MRVAVMLDRDSCQQRLLDSGNSDDSGSPAKGSPRTAPVDISSKSDPVRPVPRTPGLFHRDFHGDKRRCARFLSTLCPQVHLAKSTV